MTERQIKKELERQAVLFEEKVSSGATANGSMRFADFAEKYMTEYAALYLKPKTIATYTENLSRINQAIGHIRLSDLRTGHINSFYLNLQESGVRSRTTGVCKIDLQAQIGTQRGALTAFSRRAGVSRATINQALAGKPVNKESADAIAQAVGMKTNRAFTLTTHSDPLAPASVISYHRTLSSILGRAVKWGYIQINPADAAEKPSLGQHEAPSWKKRTHGGSWSCCKKNPSAGGPLSPSTSCRDSGGKNFSDSAGRTWIWTNTQSPSGRLPTTSPGRACTSARPRRPAPPAPCLSRQPQ